MKNLNQHNLGSNTHEMWTNEENREDTKLSVRKLKSIKLISCTINISSSKSQSYRNNHYTLKNEITMAIKGRGNNPLFCNIFAMPSIHY